MLNLSKVLKYDSLNSEYLCAIDDENSSGDDSDDADETDAAREMVQQLNSGDQSRSQGQEGRARSPGEGGEEEQEAAGSEESKLLL